MKPKPCDTCRKNCIDIFTERSETDCRCTEYEPEYGNKYENIKIVDLQFGKAIQIDDPDAPFSVCIIKEDYEKIKKLAKELGWE